LDGIAASGLQVVRMRDVIPRETLPPLFTLFACRHPRDSEGSTDVEPDLTVRHADGRLTGEMEDVRRGFGFAAR
jgi:tRNA1(Val) A37 N6-methylase TrmN6